MKINITNTLCSSPLLCCCFTAGLKNSLNLLIEINKQPSSEHTNFPGLFLQKAKANKKSVTLRLPALALIIMPTKLP